jgi:hypothetical protein
LSDTSTPPPTSRPKPTWDTPARIDGLPAKNWKTREGVTLAATLADCIARWLELQGYQQRDCTLGWGPLDGYYGHMSASAMAFFVRKNGLPPKLAAQRGGQPSAEVLEQLVSMPAYDAVPRPAYLYIDRPSRVTASRKVRE